MDPWWVVLCVCLRRLYKNKKKKKKKKINSNWIGHEVGLLRIELKLKLNWTWGRLVKNWTYGGLCHVYEVTHHEGEWMLRINIRIKFYLKRWIQQIIHLMIWIRESLSDFTNQKYESGGGFCHRNNCPLKPVDRVSRTVLSLNNCPSTLKNWNISVEDRRAKRNAGSTNHVFHVWTNGQIQEYFLGWFPPSL